MKNHDKSFESSYLMYLDASSLYGWAMSQNVPVNCFDWGENTHKFNERFIKTMTKTKISDIFLK